MSITIEKNPALVALVGNRIEFKLKTDNNITTPGSIYVLELTFHEVADVGDSLLFEWGGDISINFDFVAVPDDSGTQLPTTPAFVDDWVFDLAVAMNLNYFINRDFIVTSALDVLTFTARDKGTLYIIDYSFEWAGTFPPSASSSGGANEVYRPFFKLGLQVLIESAGDYIKIAEDLLAVDADAEALFDIHKTFTDYIESEFKFPEASDQLFILRENLNREYKIRYYEIFGSGIVPQILTESASFWAMNSGISHIQEAIYNRQDSSYWDKLTYDNWFLTWQPLSKKIDRYTTEKLYFLVQDGTAITKLNQRVKIYYRNGTTTSSPHVLKGEIVSPKNKGVYEMVCTLNVLQLPGYDDETIEKYDVWIEDQNDDRISEIRTYELDYEYPENVREFIFRNSLGGFDTLRCTGDFIDNLEYDRTDISKVLGEDFTEKNHQISAHSVSESKVYQANTGWKEAEDVSWIRDFLLSKEVFQIITRKLMPVVITSTKATQSIDRDDFYSISFEYRRAFKNEYFSKQILHADFNDDFNDDFANE